jgi:hypothetical protein
MVQQKNLKNKFFLEIIVVYIIFLSSDCLIVVTTKRSVVLMHIMISRDNTFLERPLETTGIPTYHYTTKTTANGGKNDHIIWPNDTPFCPYPWSVL